MTEGSAKRPLLVPIIVGSAFLMQGVDRTIITTALPAIADSFGVNPVDLGITIIAYILSMGVFLPISGWLADRFGARVIFVTAILIFISGSLFCSFSGSVLELTFARVYQGIGAALIFPVGRMVALHNIPKSDYIRSMVIVSLFPALGTVLGPSIGGFLTTFASWQWIFLVNIPFGLIGIVLILLYVDNFRVPERQPLDWMGFVLTGITVAAVMYGVEWIGRGGADIVYAAALLAFGIGMGAIAVRHAKRHPHPLVDLTLMQLQTLRKNVLTGTLFRITVGGLPFLLPLLFQVVFGMTAFHSGLLIVALGVGVFSVRFFVERLLKAFGFRTCLLLNTAVFVFGLVACTFITQSTPMVIVVVLLYVIGLAQGFEYTTLTTMAFAEVPQERMGAATSFVQMFQQSSQGVGVAVAACLLHIGLAMRGVETLAISDFVLAFLFLAFIDVVAFISFWRLPPDAGGEVSGHTPKS